jgi:integrase
VRGKIDFKRKEWPKKIERPVEAYTDDEITALLEAAYDENTKLKDNHNHIDERLLIRAFLYSGLRSGEKAHLTYADIDFTHSVWRVQSDPDWSAKTESSNREVPVDPEITKKIKARMEQRKASRNDLIFPTKNNQPDEHLVRVVKRVAKRAGLTGRCDDHKFRATAITAWLRHGVTIMDVKAWVGHKTTEIIERYYEAMKLRDKKTVEQSAAPFRKFSGVGGEDSRPSLH